MEVENYSKNFIAGGTALGTAFAVMHPIDSFKTQLVGIPELKQI